MHFTFSNLYSDRRGVTILEVIMATAIFVIGVGVLYYFITQGVRVESFSLDQSSAIAEARRGIETMSREIREIQIADNGAYPVIEADNQQFIFYGDIDKDDSVERVRYFLDGTDFNKGTIEPRTNPTVYLEADEQVVTLSRYVRNDTLPIFTYYNGSWPGDEVNNPLATPADVTDVRYVNIFLRINVKPSIAPSDFDLSTDVAIRNLKDNL